MLNQFVADCTGRQVVAGPSEATAIGNILVQAMGAGELGGLDEIRAVVRNSCAPVTRDPAALEGMGTGVREVRTPVTRATGWIRLQLRFPSCCRRRAPSPVDGFPATYSTFCCVS